MNKTQYSLPHVEIHLDFKSAREVFKDVFARPHGKDFKESQSQYFYFLKLVLK